MQRIVLALAALSLTVLFTACGQSGPLYLPGNPSTIERIPPASPDEEGENPESGDDAR